MAIYLSHIKTFAFFLSLILLIHILFYIYTCIYQKESAGLQKKQVANKTSGQSMQEEIVNSNAMDDMFVAFTMVQQILTVLSSGASEEEKVSIITNSVVSLLKRNGGYSS
jgi:uncharacterized protein (UPF0333 family)